MVTATNRGKRAEAIFKKHLTQMATVRGTTFYRLPDAHAGSYTATLADFLLLQSGKLSLLEVKSTLHEYRLPHGNFSTDQVGRQRLWQDAGAQSLVFIYHEALNLWRMRPIDYFMIRTGGSWDLRDTEPKPLGELLCAS
jgi:penicillin-binding protein-related factor A (putative recombinase)